MKNFILNKRGSSLTGVLMGSAALAALSMGVATMFKDQATAQANLARKYEALDLRRNLDLVFTDANLCECHFKGLRPTQSGKIPVEQLRAGCENDSPVIAAKGQTLGTGSAALKIAELSLNSLNRTGTTLRSSFHVNFERQNDYSIIPAPIRMTQIFGLDASGAIASCTPSIEIAQSTLKQICERFGGSFNSATEECKLKPIAANCPNGQLASGISNDGTLQCASIDSHINARVTSILNDIDFSRMVASEPTQPPAYNGPKFTWNSGFFKTENDAAEACRRDGKALATSQDVSRAIASAQATGQKLRDVLSLPAGTPAIIQLGRPGLQNIFYPGHNKTETIDAGTGDYNALCL